MIDINEEIKDLEVLLENIDANHNLLLRDAFKRGVRCGIKYEKERILETIDINITLWKKSHLELENMKIARKDNHLPN